LIALGSLAVWHAPQLFEIGIVFGVPWVAQIDFFAQAGSPGAVISTCHPSEKIALGPVFLHVLVRHFSVNFLDVAFMY
jgi:hypothetical protein